MLIRLVFICCCAHLAIRGAMVAAQDAGPLDANTEFPSNSAAQLTKPGDLSQGKTLINSFCSRCHGINGKGGKGPDLTAGVFRHGASDAEIIRNIRDGIPGTGMPSHFGSSMNLWPAQILSYMRSEASRRTQQQHGPRGNVALGYELFKKNKCGSCHWGPASDGRRGTDLTRLRATPDYVRASLIDPDSQIDGGYQPLVMVMDDGTVRQGMRMHENSYFVLLMDEEEKLHAVAKSQIDELRKPHKSLMPSFAKELTAKDVEDLTAYIFSLQEDSQK